jgi:hypothetical protein
MTLGRPRRRDLGPADGLFWFGHGFIQFGNV